MSPNLNWKHIYVHNRHVFYLRTSCASFRYALPRSPPYLYEFCILKSRVSGWRCVLSLLVCFRPVWLSGTRSWMFTPVLSVPWTENEMWVAIFTWWNKIGALGDSAASRQDVNCITSLQKAFHDVDCVSKRWFRRKHCIGWGPAKISDLIVLYIRADVRKAALFSG